MEEIKNKALDSVDLQILAILQREVQLSNAELARRVNLSPPATHTRVKRLETEGYIDQQVAILNQEKLGFDLLCYVFMSTNIHQAKEIEELEDSLKTMTEIMECHCLTGAYDYLLKVVIRDRKELDQFIRKLNKLGVSRIQTNLSLREIKYSTVLPIEENSKCEF
ncbi:MAG TPA: Lrp/AsnC family transcriptional regulator [Lysinibacillus sp.]|jgi:Lrp/AsnC family leucine-responsive transcriptional regulator|uniref:Lrp/AsnC family transcriptional regulator n=1 Tax=Lysinibacillus fusiformis TaxID=28031 RepID=A0A2I0UZ47_9BACI|nr:MULTISPECIES: Lrp/AsnC family transcriptional regulator [Lysinibacillus]HBT74313.1 Lrp/AsnC family transcriptional regulator [Lysinibacillus sp.]KUF32646.1 AsnC family transcriptional regulator [Lysinibacillus sp. F5]MEE3806639.1 Lrp/AsnC family transcriptional regulator [Lysinibacillus fusiformis]PKU51347.1 Lrp/AsnC family transcriptional regulator [Lysinibacillus fusiformis]WCH49791.1 Lrp/AsnC family transcriptional regulator [Lysinibacillus sp. OF-1]